MKNSHLWRKINNKSRNEVKWRDMKYNEIKKEENYVMKWNKWKEIEWNEVHWNEMKPQEIIFIEILRFHFLSWNEEFSFQEGK